MEKQKRKLSGAAIFLIIIIVAIVLICTYLIVLEIARRNLASYTNLYINGKFIEQKEYEGGEESKYHGTRTLYYLYKYDGKEIKISPRFISHGVEPEGSFYGDAFYTITTYKVDHTTYPATREQCVKTCPEEAGYYPKEVGYYEIDVSPHSVERDAGVKIYMYVFDTEMPELKYHIYPYFDSNREEWPSGSTFVYQYNGLSHEPSITYMLSNATFDMGNDVNRKVKADYTMTKDGKVHSGVCIEKGAYTATLTVHDYKWGAYTIKGFTATINWIIE